MVLCVQPGDEPVRFKGHLRLVALRHDLRTTMWSRDRIEMSAFDSHRKLYQDGTAHRGAVEEALWDAV